MTAKDKKNSFESILNDRTSGSSGLLADLNEHFLQIIEDKKTLREEIRIAEEKLHNFAAITNYLGELAFLLDNDFGDALEFLRSFNSEEMRSIRNIYTGFRERIKGKDKMLTISNSWTLVKIFELLEIEFPDVEIFVCESSPGNEGVVMARELDGAGLNIKLIHDADAENLLPEIDAFVSGADKIFSDGDIVNKTGTRKLALACRNSGVPFYVLASRKKLVPRETETWNKNSSPSGKEKRATVPSLFEEIEADLITAIITD